MGFLNKKKSMEQLEEESEHLTIESEISSKKADIAEREAVVSELKKKYGSGWAKTLGVSKFTDLHTLRSFLVSAKQGLEKKAGSGFATPISQAATSFKGLPRA